MFKRPVHRPGSLFLALALLGVGIALGLNAGHKLVLDQFTRSWPQAQGVVLQSKLSSEYREYHKSSRTYYSLDLEYEYWVQTGTEGPELPRERHTAKTLVPDYDTVADDESLQWTVQKYPVGTPVMVYYDPANPSRAALEIPSLTGRLWEVFSQPLIFWIMGFFLTYEAFRAPKTSKVETPVSKKKVRVRKRVFKRSNRAVLTPAQAGHFGA